jgi:hypothetical protein
VFGWLVSVGMLGEILIGEILLGLIAGCSTLLGIDVGGGGISVGVDDSIGIVTFVGVELGGGSTFVELGCSG